MFDRLRQEESFDSFIRAMHSQFKTTDKVDLAEMRVTIRRRHSQVHGKA